MLNYISVQGRLVRDPELHYTQNNTAVTSFTIAVDRDYGQKEADFIDCVAWRAGAEFISKYFAKGRMIIVCGRLQSRKYQDRNGNDRTAWEIQVDQAYFSDSAKGGNGDAESRGRIDSAENSASRQSSADINQRKREQQYEEPTHFVIDEEDPDLPF